MTPHLSSPPTLLPACIRQFRQDLKLWLFCILSLELFRVSFILFFRGKMEAATRAGDILWALACGLQNDTQVATVLVSLPFLLSVGNLVGVRQGVADRFRRSLGELFCVVAAFVSVVTFIYFKEFDSQLNQFVLNLYYDDSNAILRTIWAGHSVIIDFFIVGILVALGVTALRQVLRETEPSGSRAAGSSFLPVAGIAVIIILFAVSVKYDQHGNSALQQQNIPSVKDEFLHKALDNPFTALFHTVRYLVRYGDTGIDQYLPDKDVRRAAQALFKDPAFHPGLDGYMKKEARGASAPPRHVFLLVMESYDAWPMMERYRTLGLTGSLKGLAAKGIAFENFLPAGDRSMESLYSIITGLPCTSATLATHPNSGKEHATSLPGIFRRLGYRTRLFYGGPLKWQNFGEFARAQGFDEQYGAEHVGNYVKHSWGVEDEHLFDFAARTVDDSRPSFNLIYSTSYHSPYHLDVYGKGFPLRQVPPDLVGQFDGTTTLETLGHLWYADRCLGRFVSGVSGKIPKALFAVTGDHYSNVFLNGKPGLFERAAVPFVLYSRDLLKNVRAPAGVAGSHIDIGPTLVELAAPPHFIYETMGADLLSARRDRVAIGWNRVAGSDYIAQFSGAEKIEPLPGHDLPKPSPSLDDLRLFLLRSYAVGLWRAKFGPHL